MYCSVADTWCSIKLQIMDSIDVEKGSKSWRFKLYSFSNVCLVMDWNSNQSNLSLLQIKWLSSSSHTMKLLI